MDAAAAYRSIVLASTHVNDGSVAYVRDGLPQYFVCNWSSIALAKKQEPEYIRDRVPLLPFEIDVRDTSRGLFNVNQKGRDGICNDRALSAEDAVIPDSLSLDFEPLIEI